uniref:translation initiation factor IF-2-like n=1 Tax=Callithrix jacchus TaxID=9483 RepID=UPI0023DD4297|nr:translation initiation factor IF-2-like [Callithrix jacchus]
MARELPAPQAHSRARGSPPLPSGPSCAPSPVSSALWAPRAARPPPGAHRFKAIDPLVGLLAAPRPTPGPTTLSAFPASARGIPRLQVARAERREKRLEPGASMGCPGSAPRGRAPGKGVRSSVRGFVCFLLSLKIKPSPAGEGCVHSPWRCRPRKRPSDRPCPGGGGGDGAWAAGPRLRWLPARPLRWVRAALRLRRGSGSGSGSGSGAPGPAPRAQLAGTEGAGGPAGARALVLLLRGAADQAP